MTRPEDSDLDLERAVWDIRYRESVKAYLRDLDNGGPPAEPSAAPLGAVQSEESFDTAFTIAFQPILDMAREEVFAYEALVRGINGGDPASFFRALSAPDLYVFDRLCRAKAVREAARLGLTARLSLNVLPNAACNGTNGIAHTIHAARESGLSPSQLIFEITEGEELTDPRALLDCLEAYRSLGVRSAIDDFGDGYAGLTRLVRVQPDFVKIDRELVRDIHHNRAAQATLDGVMKTCRELDLGVIAEGVETGAEIGTLRSFGVAVMQGHAFARPAINELPAPATAVPAP